MQNFHVHGRRFIAVAALVALAAVIVSPRLARAGEADKNKATYTEMVEQVFNKGNLDFFDQVTSPTFVEHEQMPPGMSQDREGCKKFFQAIRTAFPDLHVTIGHMIAEGDLVAAHLTWNGTHKGEFMGVPATGRPVVFDAMDFVRCKDGKAIEHWGVSDVASLMEQLQAPAKTDK